MEWLRRIIEERSTRAGRVFDLAVQLLIVTSLVSFSIETLPDLSEPARRALRAIEVVTVIIFTAEYALRIIVSRRRLRFIFSFFGLVDLLAILPFYLSPGVDLRSIRAFRLLRLFRAFKLLRYSMAIRRYRRAFQMAREDLILFFSVAVLLFFFAGVGIYYFESKAQPEAFRSIFHSLWWAVSTLTTVGYGDVYPITAGGRIFTCVLLILGLGFVAVPSGLMASTLAEARRAEDKESG